MNDAHDDLLAVLRHLHHLQASMQQEEEVFRRVALLEHGVALRDTPSGRMGEQPVEILVGHFFKEGERANDDAVDFHNETPLS